MDSDEKIQEILHYYGSLHDKESQENVVSMLRELQEVDGYLSPEIKALAAKTIGVQTSFIQGIIKRFPTLKEAPYHHEIILCSGARCGNKGGHALIQTIEKALGMDGPGLSPNGAVYLKIRNCLKQCRTSPNLYIDGKLYSNVQLSEIVEIIKDLK